MIMIIIIIIKFLIMQKFILEQLNINSNTITNTVPTFVHKDIIGCLLPIIGPIIIILSILLLIVYSVQKLVFKRR